MTVSSWTGHDGESRRLVRVDDVLDGRVQALHHACVNPPILRLDLRVDFVHIDHGIWRDVIGIVHGLEGQMQKKELANIVRADDAGSLVCVEFRAVDVGRPSHALGQPAGAVALIGVVVVVLRSAQVAHEGVEAPGGGHIALMTVAQVPFPYHVRRIAAIAQQLG